MTLYSDLVRNSSRLNKVMRCLPHYLGGNLLGQKPFVGVLKELTGKEISVREERVAKNNLKTGNFPYRKMVVLRYRLLAGCQQSPDARFQQSQVHGVRR